MARPTGFESRRRERELLRLLAAGRSLEDAAREARVDGLRLLAMLGVDAAFRMSVFALVDAAAAAA